MALNVVYLRVQGRLRQCHVSDGDMMVFRYYSERANGKLRGIFCAKPTWYWVDTMRLRAEMKRKRELYAEKLVKSGQYLIIKEYTNGVTSV